MSKGFQVLVLHHIYTIKTSVVPDREYNTQLEKGLTTNLISTGRDFKSHTGYKVARANKNILGLKNIVIDIDCHDDLSPEEILSIRTSYLDNYDEMFGDSLPLPTVMYWTGRGFQIWYSLKDNIKIHKRINNLIQMGVIYAEAFGYWRFSC